MTDESCLCLVYPLPKEPTGRSHAARSHATATIRYDSVTAPQRYQFLMMPNQYRHLGSLQHHAPMYRPYAQ